jgi:hypothetical protein
MPPLGFLHCTRCSIEWTLGFQEIRASSANNQDFSNAEGALFLGFVPRVVSYPPLGFLGDTEHFFVGHCETMSVWNDLGRFCHHTVNCDKWKS